jgi:hypothetical protein
MKSTRLDKKKIEQENPEKKQEKTNTHKQCCGRKATCDEVDSQATSLFWVCSKESERYALLPSDALELLLGPLRNLVCAFVA